MIPFLPVLSPGLWDMKSYPGTAGILQKMIISQGLTQWCVNKLIGAAKKIPTVYCHPSIR